MKKKITALFLAIGMVTLSACTITVNTTEDKADVAKKAQGGRPWIDSDIKSNVTPDLATDPRDDFHLYANKEWILENDIPEGYSSWSPSSERELEVRKQCMGILEDESIEGHDAQIIRTYYNLCLDWDAREKLGVSEIEDTYNKLLNIKSIDDLNALYDDPDVLIEITPFIDFSATPGITDAEYYKVGILTPSLLLDDSAEYKDRTEYGDMFYGRNKDDFTYMAKRMGMSVDDAGKCFDDAIAFEAKLAEKIYTSWESMQDDYYEKANNEMDLDELTGHCKSFPIRRLLDNAGYAYDGSYLVVRPDYLDHLDGLYTDENIDGMKACLIVHYLLGYIASTDKEAYDFANATINRYFGTSGKVSDEEMAYDTVARALPACLQKVYISEYGSEEDRQKMYDLCKAVIDTYREMLSENDWASDEVKQLAIKKLDNMTIHAAYPDKFRDTSNIDLDGCSLIEANRRLTEYNVEYNRSLIGKAVDKDMWAEGFNILSCNAFYSQTQNTINMIIGMMGEPFFSSDMSTEDLYASIAAYWVGHEISHAFDSGGSQFDENGKFRNWWPDKDKEEFGRRVKKMDAYLDGFVAFGDEHFTGSNIDTEMTADMTGLQCALKMASKVDGFDYDEFFKKYAQMNASLDVYSTELSMLKQDVHPLDYSRTNVPVQQFEEFYATYDVREGDNMYLAPQDRLIIW